MDQEIRNYMEICVEDALMPILKTLDVCTCERCRCDIMAIALNALPPKYVVTPRGHLFSKIDTLRQQNDVDLISAITKGATIVSRMPRHDD